MELQIPGDRSSPLSRMTPKDRLSNSHKKFQEKIDLQLREKLKKEKESLSFQSYLSPGSKKLLSEKQKLPLTSRERLNEIATKKREKIEKIKREIEIKKKMDENKISFQSPSTSTASRNIEICYDPYKVKSLIFSQKKVVNKESTEQQEIKACCSFKPQTNKKSASICSKVSLIY